MKCNLCGKTVPKTAIERHHLIPRRFGGDDSPGNIVELCANCHRVLESLYTDRVWEKWTSLEYVERLNEIEQEFEEWKEKVGNRNERATQDAKELLIELIEDGVPSKHLRPVKPENAGCPQCMVEFQFVEKGQDEAYCTFCGERWWVFEWVEYEIEWSKRNSERISRLSYEIEKEFEEATDEERQEMIENIPVLRRHG